MEESKVPSQEQIKAVEAEVNKKLSEEMSKTNQELAKSVREEVEKEYQQKSQMEKMQQEIVKAQEDARLAREESDKKLQELQSTFKKELQDALATRQGLAQNKSPFEAETTSNNMYKGVDLNKMEEIEAQSREAFKQKFGIRNPEWGVPANKY